MDLNHARLPIPPRWQVDFNSPGSPQAAGKAYTHILQTVRIIRQQCYSSFALIVIFALSTFETGHPFSAASAYFWNVAASAPGTLPTTSM